ncbi:nitrous oxide-stimulated promoter family protein [Poseidonibacter antarcticus]|uniref:nitrous oxide-stimulated promoter family protein n=1 Tax=Poseidonibacter antarcticus TaxID=2478538 RepID=UPI000EF4FE18|nr:nitrous oxide-stimulated promoter family protein [Poseidonibacter antarcticus]
MTTEKFEIEINTLKKFFELYCKDKHDDQIEKEIILKYKDKEFMLNLSLCPTCYDSINYSFERLKQCQHEIKPRCRTCPTPCYEKIRWKNAAKVMKYSAIKLSLSKVKKRIKSIFS